MQLRDFGPMLARPLAERGPTATELRARAAAAERAVADDLARIAAELDGEPAQADDAHGDRVKHATKSALARR